MFDVATFDMIAMLRLPFQPATAEWVYQVPLLTCRLGALLLFLPFLMFVVQQCTAEAARCQQQQPHAPPAAQRGVSRLGLGQLLVVMHKACLLHPLNLMPGVPQAGRAAATLAVADQDSPQLHIYDARSGLDLPQDSFSVGRAPVVAMRYVPRHDAVISLDSRGTPACFAAAALPGAGLSQAGSSARCARPAVLFSSIVTANDISVDAMQLHARPVCVMITFSPLQSQLLPTHDLHTSRAQATLTTGAREIAACLREP